MCYRVHGGRTEHGNSQVGTKPTKHFTVEQIPCLSLFTIRVGRGSSFHRGQTVRNQRQSSKPDSSGVEDGVADRWGYPHDRCFAGTCRWKILAIQEDSFDIRDVPETRNAIARKTRIRNAAILEFDGFEKRPAQSLNI